ncbi:MAG: hypothetical protein GY782_11930 [Gammaproteobacteria bacterium]|nr:hypothetical protein [Gammaproteobacteria bacterium]
MQLKRIVSGGQSGVDRAALDIAMAMSIVKLEVRQPLLIYFQLNS